MTQIHEGTLISNVNIIPMTNDTILKGMDLIVAQGKIASIKKIEKSKAGYQLVIDGEGAYLLPGLIRRLFIAPGTGNVQASRFVKLSSAENSND
ncbi:MAG: hypothetical protein KDD94_08785 [Calditrichaeota bacterium]|nr:hypothetical protein [Calditrichota bacterium]